MDLFNCCTSSTQC
ncbi:hypothetical protein OYC64_002884 [Pagothenia borchgrevinki]|uniref:Uncharacterized protein n=1 Tax=Pagothenia borchgrevinki TaxID=8213 RepID=A0ABD2H9L3_PAGBO